MIKHKVSVFIILASILLTMVRASAGPEREFLVISGAPAVNKWERYRVPADQHDMRFWGNFIGTAVIRMKQLRKLHGPDARITWLVYRRGYEIRGQSEGKPLTSWINEKEEKYGFKVVWFSTGDDVIRYINRGQNRRRVKIANLDYFGHSNRHAFMFDYSAEILGCSKSYLHEKDLKKIKGSSFMKSALIKSWGCHTGESMSRVWRRSTGTAMWGAVGKTNYKPLAEMKLPVLSRGVWVR